MGKRLRIVMYATEFCSYCMAARMLFKKKGVSIEEISVADDPAKFREMVSRSGMRSVPQIFINENAVGGFDELYTLEKSGNLDELLSQE